MEWRGVRLPLCEAEGVWAAVVVADWRDLGGEVFGCFPPVIGRDFGGEAEEE